MRALVVYESMFGNTRLVAKNIVRALERAGVSTSLTTAGRGPCDTSGFDVVFVGAPTHAHGLPRPESRLEAATWAANPAKSLSLEPLAIIDGVREWLETLTVANDTSVVAAFSTRSNIMRLVAGDAAVGIARRLKPLGVARVDKECFLVDRANRLLPGESDRADAWATDVLEHVGAAAR